MQVIVNKLKTDYLKIGTGPTLVFLHGWSKGINKQRYLKLFQLLSPKFQIIALDFPGFGASDTPTTPWTVSDYAQFTNNFLDKLKINKCILIGHSFGGRVAITLASQHNPKIQKIILIDAAGIERKSLKIKLISTISGFIPPSLKKLLLPALGSKDYLDTNGVMRQTFKNIVNQNLEELLPQINIPTHLIWGGQDYTTPLSHAQIIHKLIPQSTLDVVPNANHGLPYRQPQETYQLIKKVLL